jgi:hypothetical protein
MFDGVTVLLFVGVALAGVVTGSAITVWLLAEENKRWTKIGDAVEAERAAIKDAADRVLRHATLLTEPEPEANEQWRQCDDPNCPDINADGSHHAHRVPTAARFVARRPDDVPGPVPVSPSVTVQPNPYVFDFVVNPNSKVVHRTECKYATLDCLPLTSMGLMDLRAVMEVDGSRACKRCDPLRERETAEV